MMNLFKALMPREERFFDMFNRHAGTLILGAQALRDLMEPGADVAGGCGRIVQHEHEADEVAREGLLAVRRTFITPFDRGDIKELFTSLDDAIDQMQKTAKAITLFDVRAFDPKMREMGETIVAAAERTAMAVAMLNDLAKNATALSAATEEITQLEEKSDGMYDAGLKALLQGTGAADPMGFIVGREIYNHLEKVMDRFEDVANRLNGILIEHL